jgi:hypothetical protein
MDDVPYMTAYDMDKKEYSKLLRYSSLRYISFNIMEVDAIALHRFSDSNIAAADQDNDGIGKREIHVGILISQFSLYIYVVDA